MRYILVLTIIITIFSCGKTKDTSETVNNKEPVSSVKSSGDKSLQDSTKSQVRDTKFKARLSPCGKENIVKIHSTFFPETKERKFTELKYTVSIDGKEKDERILSTGEIKLNSKTIDIDKSDDYEHLLIYYITDDPVNADLPYYSEYLFVYDNAPELAAVFRANEPITYGNGFINYTDNFGFGKIDRKCTIEKNKFKEIHKKEYLLEKKDGIITEPITLYSLPDIKSSVVEKTYIN